MSNSLLVIGADPFEAADSNSFVFDPASSAYRFTGSVADSAKNAGKNIGVPVDHVGIVIAPGCYEPNIFRDRRMGGATVLAVDHSVKIFRIVGICRVQGNFSSTKVVTAGHELEFIDILTTISISCEAVFSKFPFLDRCMVERCPCNNLGKNTICERK
jgi:hypothetical protein